MFYLLLLACSQDIEISLPNYTISIEEQAFDFESYWPLDTGEIDNLDQISVGCNDDFETIYEGLNLARRLGVSEITICKGVYRENLFIDFDLKINSDGFILLPEVGTALTIIDAKLEVNNLLIKDTIGDVGGAVYINNSEVYFFGFGLLNSTSNMGNIYLKSSGVKFINGKLTDNNAESGSVFYLDDSSLSLTNIDISNNIAQDGAVVLNNSVNYFEAHNVWWNTGEPIFNPNKKNQLFDVWFDDNDYIWGYNYLKDQKIDIYCHTDPEKYPMSWRYNGICL